MPISPGQRSEFEEATAFERYAITSSIPAHDAGMTSASVDLRSSPGQVNVEGGAVIAVGLSENLSAGAVSSTVARLRPLLFGAAFKVLDLTLELALEGSGLSPVYGRRWRIDEKVAQARLCRGEVDPLTTRFPEVWERLCALYVVWEDVRHSLVHRTAQVDATSGELVGRDRHGQPLKPLTAEDQEQFGRLVAEASEAVVTGALSSRSAKRLAWRCNQVKNHHGLADLQDASAPGTAVEVQGDLERLPDGKWRLDAAAALTSARKVFGQANEFDGIFHAATESKDRKFTCHLEEAPASIDFDLDALPFWLVESSE